MDEKMIWLHAARNGKGSVLKKILKQHGTIDDYKYEEKVNIDEMYEYYEKECAGRGIGFVYREEPEFPESLTYIAGCPMWLFYIGHIPANDTRRIAVVGARGCSPYGSEYAGKISYDLARAGTEVVSGLALGIDAKAHRGALNASGVTYAVLGCGPDICYPKENFDIYNMIPERGGIISEYPPGTKPLSAFFPQRNRIISGLSDGVLIVEAREKSGSLITAGIGLEQGKNIYALPGKADDPMSIGCNRLIKEGAKLITRAEDILEDFEFYGLISQASNEPSKILLETTEKIVYSTLRFEPRHINELRSESGLSYAETLSALMTLCLKGYAAAIGTDYYVAKQFLGDR